MKTIGLIGGMSWESTATYYKLINEGIKERLGGFHSGKILLYSVDFHDIEKLQRAGEWERMGELLSDAARNLEAGGADFLLLCTNTMHKVAPQIENSLTIPFVHIADAAAQKLSEDGKKTVALLGTSFTMEKSFYRERMNTCFGLNVLTPDKAGREKVHGIIYDELVKGTIREDSRNELVTIIEGMAAEGAEAVILGCTELGLLVTGEYTDVPLYDTARIHAMSAVEKALSPD